MTDPAVPPERMGEKTEGIPMEWSAAFGVPFQWASTAVIPESVWRGLQQAARGEGVEIDPMTLTDEKVDARDAEARAAEADRFKSWPEVRDGLREHPTGDPNDA